jgi:CRISPR-associated endonuclease/helicase Cas3
MASFDSFFSAATGGAVPYEWQRRVAEDGLPELIDVETGAGKTAGVVLGWLWRRTRSADPEIRRRALDWLVLALPMRSLVDQTEEAVRTWVGAAAPEVEVYGLRGGEGRVDAAWRERPGQPTVIVGTIDMLVSRALNRGYAANRWRWPVEMGLLHTGAHWVFDEVQLMGPALATTRQLAGLRGDLGTLAPCRSTWMSATVDPEQLRTVDNPEVPVALVLGEEDRAGPLARRLHATRTVGELSTGNGAMSGADLAASILAVHQPATRTLVVLNTVRDAIDVVGRLRRCAGEAGPQVDLMHARYRSVDRGRIVQRAITEAELGGAGRILVATQVVEAGVDLTSTTLVTAAAPWPSIVQRAGRCNRDGAEADARLLWFEPPSAGPYMPADVQASVLQLRRMEGKPVTATDLRLLGRSVRTTAPIVPVLRRKDLLQLFDTAPDLSGNDVDVSRFIRDGDDLDLFVCWREQAPEGAPEPFEGGSPQPGELCRVPLDVARGWLRGKVAWVADPRARRRHWVRADANRLRPGAVVVVSASAGGYDPAIGFDDRIKVTVPVADLPASPELEHAPPDETIGDDPATVTGAWVRLAGHLDDAETAAGELLAELEWSGLDDGLRTAVARAAALHDLGKAHPVFQASMRAAMGDERSELFERMAPLAKSGSLAPLRHERPHFRHELVSALLVRMHAGELLGDLEADLHALVGYLVAAHHGRVRMAIRSVPDERPPPDRPTARIALGVVDGDRVPAIDLGDRKLPPSELDLDTMSVGGPDAWSTASAELLERLGPFRLAALEALVCLADWRASRAPAAPGRGERQ